MAQAIETKSDFGFSVEFHSSGVLFGAAFQDGRARLYDIRNLKTELADFVSTRVHESAGALRCLKFTQGPEDLMFLTEQHDRVHIIDLRDFDDHQVLSIPELGQQGGSAGASDVQTLPSIRDAASQPSNLQPYSDVVERHLPLRMRAPHASRSSQHSMEAGLSGLAWNSYKGGSLVVGTAHGIGVWNINSRARRTFPSFSICT
jgi:hypothetical protein